MDLFENNPSFREAYSLSEQPQFGRSKNPVSLVQNEITKFASSDILSSSAWSSVIHQPSHDSEPEDLPSTVDIDAIKEPFTPLFPLSSSYPGQTANNDSDSHIESDSDSESSNNEDENTDGGADLASFSDSSSISSHSSSSSSCEPKQQRSSPIATSISTSIRDKLSSVQETNFNNSGVEPKPTEQKLESQRLEYSDSSDSSESKTTVSKTWSKLASKTQQRRKSSKPRKERSKQSLSTYNHNSDCDSSSSSSSGPIKTIKSSTAEFLSKFNRDCNKNRSEIENLNKSSANILHSLVDSSSYFQRCGIQLPQVCDLSEHSDDSGDSSMTKSKQLPNENIYLRTNNPQQLPKLKNNLEEQHDNFVLKEIRTLQGHKQFVMITSNSSDNSESEMLPKQIVRGVINSIRFDFESFRHSTDNFSYSKVKSDEYSSFHKDEAVRRKLKDQYSSPLIESCAEKTNKLNRKSEKKRPFKRSDNPTSISFKDEGERSKPCKVLRKRRPTAVPRIQLEDYVNSKASPDIEFQSKSSPPSYRRFTKFSHSNANNKIDSLKWLRDTSKDSNASVFQKCNSASGLHLGDDSDSRKLYRSSSSAHELNDMLRVPPYFVPNPSIVAEVKEKRGPGRPRKNSNVLQSRNNEMNASKEYNSNHSFLKFSSNALKYDSFILLRNSKSNFQNLKDLKHKQKKHKKKTSHEKPFNPDSLKDIENLIDILDKKCVIKPKRQQPNESAFRYSSPVSPSKAKSLHRVEECSNKKRKYSDAGSGSEADSTISLLASNDSRMKRKHKKSSSETSKVLKVKCDQRLPLKKRQYHVSTASSTSGVHQSTNDTTELANSMKSSEHHKSRSEYSKNASKSDSTNSDTLEVSNADCVESTTKVISIKPNSRDVDETKLKKQFVGVDTKDILRKRTKFEDGDSTSTCLRKSKRSTRSCSNTVQKGVRKITQEMKSKKSKNRANVALSILCSADNEKPAKSEDRFADPPSVLEEYHSINNETDSAISVPSNASPHLKLFNPESSESEFFESCVSSPTPSENRNPISDAILKTSVANTVELKKQYVDKICNGIRICLNKLDSGLPDMKVEPKAKVKRRKMNKTGFPVMKKKNKKPPKTERCTESFNQSQVEMTVQTKSVQRVNAQRLDNTANPINFPTLDFENFSKVPIVCNLKKFENKISERHSARISSIQQQREREKMEKKQKEASVTVEGMKHRTLREREPSNKKLNGEAGQRSRTRNEKKQKGNDDSGNRNNLRKGLEAKMKTDADKDESSDDSKKNTVPKNRIKSVIAGLFSNFYKDDGNSAAELKSRFVPYKAEDHPHGLLPPPPYFEDWVRRRNEHFKLPYDLWWLHTHNKFPDRDVIESWKYKRIKMNVYYDVKPPNVYEAQACLCVPPTDGAKLGCGDSCINRVVYAECSPDLCPLKELCSNQRIQKHNPNNLKLVRFMTKNKGIGVRTEKPIKAGDYILEYIGEVVTDREFKRRMTSLYKKDVHHYCLHLDGGLVIDSHRMGGNGRFVNHSCKPNCEIQKWNVNGLFRMALFAKCEIEPGEELSYDYNFALFNPEEGQLCHCESANCRGVIGGKTQRVNGPSYGENAINSAQNAANGLASSKKCRQRPRKQNQKPSKCGNNATNARRRDSVSGSAGENILSRPRMADLTPVEYLSNEDKTFVQSTKIFLARNLSTVRKVREKLQQMLENKENAKIDKHKHSMHFSKLLDVFSKEIFIKTRGIAHAEDNPEITKNLKLANMFKIVFNEVVSVNDDKHNKPFSNLLKLLPRKDKECSYYRQIKNPIDLNTIEMNIVNGVYKDVLTFDSDVCKVYENTLKFYGRLSEQGIAAVRMKRAYNAAKRRYISQIEEIIGRPVPSVFQPPSEDVELTVDGVIRCICGLYHDEGTMILCERCFVWQHCSCIGADKNCEHYHCELCVPREVNYEIPLDVDPPKLPKPEEKHYLTLMRDELQIRISDTVYVLRAIPNPENNSRHNFRSIKKFSHDDCDIFRIEQLWKTKNGERFAFGHHYLRPHETFHEPTRKFFPNEVLMILLYETVPLDLIMGRCHVLDASTFSKGRPVDSDPQHIYICEWRVDSRAKKFFKLTKNKATSVSTKSYAFKTYDTPLKPKRDLAPHGEVKSSHSTLTNIKENKTLRKPRGRKSKKAVIDTDFPKVGSSTPNVKVDGDNSQYQIKDLQVEKQKNRLNTILLKLLTKNATKAPLDISYLLEMGKRNRKKLLSVNPM